MKLSQNEVRARLGKSNLNDPTIKLPTRLLQRTEARQHGAATAFVIPRPNKEDVVLGRGKPYQGWPGNQLMLSLCDAYRDQYHSVDRAQKNWIIEEVRAYIRSKGGRFLGKSNLRFIS
jgi:hypothetical protein